MTTSTTERARPRAEPPSSEASNSDATPVMLREWAAGTGSMNGIVVSLPYREENPPEIGAHAPPPALREPAPYASQHTDE